MITHGYLMQYQLLSKKVVCPYCGEGFETVVDTSMVNSEYTEDCYICCRPIIFSVFESMDFDNQGLHRGEESNIDLVLRTEND